MYPKGVSVFFASLVDSGLSLCNYKTVFSNKKNDRRKHFKRYFSKAVLIQFKQKCLTQKRRKEVLNGDAFPLGTRENYLVTRGNGVKSSGNTLLPKENSLYSKSLFFFLAGETPIL